MLASIMTQTSRSLGRELLFNTNCVVRSRCGKLRSYLKTIALSNHSVLPPSHLRLSYVNISNRFNTTHPRAKREKTPFWNVSSQIVAEEGPNGSANMCHFRVTVLIGAIFMAVNYINNNHNTNTTPI